MSAPETHDPRFVNTKGACWVRRAVTSDGRGLYAVEGSCKCPEFLLVPLEELAAVGIVGSADVLPVPAAPFAERAGGELDPGRRVAWRMLAADVPDGEHFAAVHHAYRPGLGRDLPEVSQRVDRVVAYRSTEGPALRCLGHGPSVGDWGRFVPVTSEDLPDGGVCTWPSCGRDVLIDPSETGGAS